MVIIHSTTLRGDPRGSISSKNEAKTLKKLSFSIEKDNIFIKITIFSIKKLNISIEKTNISIKKDSISIKKGNISIKIINISIEKLTFSIKKTNISIEKATIFTRKKTKNAGEHGPRFGGGADHIARPNNLDFLTGFGV